jgi:hypothetical protein
MTTPEANKVISGIFENELKREKKRIIEDALEDAINVFVDAVLACRDGQENALQQREYALIDLVAAHKAAVEAAT